MMASMLHKVIIYGKKECCLCDQAMEVLLKVRESLPFNLEKKDISDNPELLAAFAHMIPVVFLDGEQIFKYRVSEGKLRSLLTCRTTIDETGWE